MSFVDNGVNAKRRNLVGSSFERLTFVRIYIRHNAREALTNQPMVLQDMRSWRECGFLLQGAALKRRILQDIERCQ